jgi:hypothetical protein
MNNFELRRGCKRFPAEMVGDKGQRYEITVYDVTQNKRVVVGWSDDKRSAENMGTAAAKRPSWNNPQVRDRKAVA